VAGRRLTSVTPGSPALRTQKLSRFVSMMKCLMSRVTAAGATNRRRNHKHIRSMVTWAENRTGQIRLPATMAVTASREATRIHG
jgi:hypothetical protein